MKVPHRRAGARVSRASLITWAIGSLCSLLPGAAVVAAPSVTQPTIAQPSLPVSAERAYGYLQVLAGEIGERPAGTPAEDRAVEYISRQFRSWGLESSTMAIPVPVWHEKRARLWTQGGPIMDFPVNAVVFSGITPATGIRGEFVDLGRASPRDLRGKDLKGKIALIKRDVYIDYPDIQLTDRLAPLGVAGLVFYSGPGRRGIPVVYYNFKRALKEPTPPAVVVSYEDAVRLVQMQPKELGLVVEADVEWKESHSVIGELKGTKKPQEIVLFTAHDDTSYTSPGAADDGGGVATIMEIARAFAQGPKPARTLRFIAWGGHELGLMGSETYLRKHADEVADTVAIVNYDGVGSALGVLDWSAAGDAKWATFLEDTTKSLGWDNMGSIGPSGTDATNFSALEVPSVQIGQSYGGGQHHTAADTLGTTSVVGMEDALTFGAMLAERLGNDTHLVFPHKFPPELLQGMRDYAARWGWGVRPEANQPPRGARP